MNLWKNTLLILIATINLSCGSIGLKNIEGNLITLESEDFEPEKEWSKNAKKHCTGEVQLESSSEIPFPKHYAVYRDYTTYNVATGKTEYLTSRETKWGMGTRYQKAYRCNETPQAKP